MKAIQSFVVKWWCVTVSVGQCAFTPALEKQKEKKKVVHLPGSIIGLYISASALTWKLRDSPGPYSNADGGAFSEEEKRITE